jgi:hypothetical protein
MRHVSSAMLSFDPQWLGQVDINSQTDLAGFIGLAGTPYADHTVGQGCYSVT